MTLYSDLYPEEAAVLARKYFKVSGNFLHVVPAGATWARIAAVGAGGLSAESWGGGGAFASSVVEVVAGETLKLQVGSVSTGGAAGNSIVRRNDDTIIVLADRGRGVGTQGLASNSTGQIRRNGSPGGSGAGGASGSDAADFAPLGFQGVGAPGSFAFGAGWGGGGLLTRSYDENYDINGWLEWAAGSGVICLEFFDKNPNYT